MSFFKHLKNYDAFCTCSEIAKMTFSFLEAKIIEIETWFFCENIVPITQDDIYSAPIINESPNIAKILVL